MYCQKCGSEMSAKLNYCKNCGARLIKEDEETEPKSMLENILTTVFLVVMFGFGILVGLIAILLNKNVADKAVIMISLFYLAALSGICYMLLSQVPKLIDANLKRKEEAAGSPEIFQPAPQLSPVTTAQLEEHREPAVVSVTENTTRTFDRLPFKEH